MVMSTKVHFRLIKAGFADNFDTHCLCPHNFILFFFMLQKLQVWICCKTYQYLSLISARGVFMVSIMIGGIMAVVNLNIGGRVVCMSEDKINFLVISA